MAPSSKSPKSGPDTSSKAATSPSLHAPKLATIDADSQAVLIRGQANGELEARVLLPNGAQCGVSQGFGTHGDYGLIHLHADDLVAAATNSAQRAILPKAYYCVPVNFPPLKRDTIRETSGGDDYFRLSQQQFLALLYASADQKPMLINKDDDDDDGEDDDDCECDNCESQGGSQVGPFVRTHGVGAKFRMACLYGVCANDVWVNGKQ